MEYHQIVLNIGRNETQHKLFHFSDLIMNATMETLHNKIMDRLEFGSNPFFCDSISIQI